MAARIIDRSTGHDSFWTEAWRLRDSATLPVLLRGLVFGLFALAVWLLDSTTETPIGIEITPYELAGAALSLLLVLRTNAGYDRWWDARKLWGGIVNQSRNLVIASSAYGPREREWRRRFARWTVAFAHVCRRSLRNERDLPEVAALVGAEEAARIAAADHMPSYVASVLAELLAEALGKDQFDRYAFLQAERERAALVDHIGGCERIQKTPLPRAYSVQIRRFIYVFLAATPFALVLQIGWLTPLATMLVAYPILALDEIGAELQYPFSPRSLNHLPLDEICSTIERNLLELAERDA
ncbi:MAG TPA: bestrophin family ion channel [Pirellulales bacterium]|jgi:putative membrane protein|nr:bestrophin family ion channel [Pirellulales bacterium]